MKSLSNSCLEALQSLRIPSTRNEDYRFTDLAPLTKSVIQVSL